MRECIQEEARLVNKEALLKEYDQALATHTIIRRQSNFKKDSHKEYIPPNKFPKKEITVRKETTPNINVMTIIR